MLSRSLAWPRLKTRLLGGLQDRAQDPVVRSATADIPVERFGDVPPCRERGFASGSFGTI